MSSDNRNSTGTNSRVGRPVGFAVISQYWLSLVCTLLAVCMLAAGDARADFDYLFFSVNGDTTGTTMVQGDEFGWGCNCDSGATINFEIWLDINANSVIEPATDRMLTVESITDGDPLSEFAAALDGYAISDYTVLSGAPGSYIFRATDEVMDSSFRRIMTMTALPSPSAQLQGRIILPGITPPNSVLANHFVSVEADTVDNLFSFTVTNNMGDYSINVGADGTGLACEIDPARVPGYVAPDEIPIVPMGLMTGNDFTYETATDSVWGYVTDENDDPLPREVRIRAESDWGGRETITSGGRYAFYFSESDSDEWSIEIDSRVSPLYLKPDAYTFDLDMISNFRYDIALTRADTSIFVHVTENGGPPANRYHLAAYSVGLESYAEAVSDTGEANLAALRVPSLQASNWITLIVDWSDYYPIPPGLEVPDAVTEVSVGDTVIFDLTSSSCCIGLRGNIDGVPDEQVSLGDLTALLDILFISLSDPLCWEEANLDESLPEGPGSVSLGDLTVLLDVLFISLNDPPPCP